MDVCDVDVADNLVYHVLLYYRVDKSVLQHHLARSLLSFPLICPTINILYSDRPS